MKKYLRIILIAVFFLMVFTTTVSAFVYHTVFDMPITWSEKEAVMYINTNSFPENSRWWDSLQRAMFAWNNAGSAFKYYWNTTASSSYMLGNFKNEVLFVSHGDISEFHPSAIAFTRPIWNRITSNMWEADVIFDVSVNWYTGPTNFNQSQFGESFEEVAVHEFGHVLGLDHTDNLTIMSLGIFPVIGGSDLDSGNTEILPDDARGVRFLYGSRGSYVDIATYSLRTDLGPCRIYPSTVDRGGEFTAEHTTGNTGTSDVSFYVGFYLSKDSVITEDDIFLGNTTIDSPVGSMGTFSQTLKIKISDNILPGKYYVGYIADYLKNTSERNRNNNTMIYSTPLIVNNIRPDAANLSGFSTSNTAVFNIYLNWGDSVLADKFEIYRSESGKPYQKIFECSRASKITEFYDNNVLPLTSYSYFIVSSNEKGSTNSKIFKKTTPADKSEPTLIISSSKYQSGSLLLTGEAYDNTNPNGVSSLTWRTGKGLTGSIVPTRNWSVNVPLAQWTLNKIYITAVDAYGNSTTVEKTYLRLW